MPRKVNILGTRFYRLCVIEEMEADHRGEIQWKCLCDCGVETIVTGYNLRSRNTKSCGCYNIDRIVKRSKQHGMYKTRIYKIWVGVTKRCTNPNMTSYADYGGRGIKVCERWSKFENFYEDMKDGYADNLSLERKNPNGDYEKSNCKWATMKEQARNKRNSKYIELGDKALTAAEWAEISGTMSSTIIWRVKNGWDVRRAIYGDVITDLSEISQYLVF